METIMAGAMQKTETPGGGFPLVGGKVGIPLALRFSLHEFQESAP